MTGNIASRVAEHAPAAYRAVLVPLDGSRLAAEALTAAASYAREAGSRLILLHVIPDRPAGSPGQGDGSPERRVQRSQMEAYLQGLKHSLSTAGLNIDVRIEEGEPASTIVDVARSIEAVVLVLTDSGMSASLNSAEPAPGAVYSQIASKWDGPLMLVNV